jgi:hypothetical protein
MCDPKSRITAVKDSGGDEILRVLFSNSLFDMTRKMSVTYNFKIMIKELPSY